MRAILRLAGGKGLTTAAAPAAAAIVAAVLRAEECCKRSLALAMKLSAELDKAKMLAACEQVSGVAAAGCQAKPPNP